MGQSIAGCCNWGFFLRCVGPFGRSLRSTVVFLALVLVVGGLAVDWQDAPISVVDQLSVGEGPRCTRFT